MERTLGKLKHCIVMSKKKYTQCGNTGENQTLGQHKEHVFSN